MTFVENFYLPIEKTVFIDSSIKKSKPIARFAFYRLKRKTIFIAFAHKFDQKSPHLQNAFSALLPIHQTHH